MKAQSPGKLILSGEHAVVHGRPALAVALAVFATADSQPHSLPEIVLRLADRPECRRPLSTLASHLVEIRARHSAFLRNEIPIRAVAPEAEDLLFAAIALAAPAEGRNITLHSAIPLGAGMGSSAAVLLALLRVLRPDWNPDELQHAAWNCEQFQHGRSSGLDVAASLRGGLIFGPTGAFQSLTAATSAHFRIFFSGTPSSSTGECVSAVRQRFPEDASIWSEFEAVTLAMKTAFLSGDRAALREQIRNNHRLLCRIGVVPESVQEFVTRVEAEGGAAKICGAGGIRPGGGGMVWVEADRDPTAPAGWERFALSISARGTHSCPS